IEERLRIRPLIWMGTGLLLAAGVGLGATVFGYPFLTTWFRYAEVPLIGSIPMASALVFDLGVFSLVVGATALILIAVAHQSVRTPIREQKWDRPAPEPAPEPAGEPAAEPAPGPLVETAPQGPDAPPARAPDTGGA